ncbi:MAG TPA: plastocyanin/azurin family copper-binding protein [Xanthomonadaceae bacterium]|nr:plastocyanin/azurin family copper-binding protein [Xanthomonadaceae bacterium]
MSTHTRRWWLALPMLGWAADAPAELFVIETEGFAFIPNAVEILVGDTVQWNLAVAHHNVVQTTGPDTCNRMFDGFMSGATESDTSQPVYSRVFDASGTYYYKCNTHCASGMRGRITVVAPSDIFADGFESAD